MWKNLTGSKWQKHNKVPQAGIQIAERNINNLRYADDPRLMAESEEELKSLLMRVKEESEKAGLKLNIKKTKIMTSGPITSWQIDEKNLEAMAGFVFLDSIITWMMTAAMDLRHLPIGRKAMTKPDSILKSRHHFADKGLSSQNYGFFSSHVLWI